MHESVVISLVYTDTSKKVVIDPQNGTLEKGALYCMRMCVLVKIQEYQNGAIDLQERSVLAEAPRRHV